MNWNCLPQFQLSLETDQRDVMHRTQTNVCFELFRLVHLILFLQNLLTFVTFKLACSRSSSLAFFFSNYVDYLPDLMRSNHVEIMLIMLNSNFVPTSFLNSRPRHQVPTQRLSLDTNSKPNSSHNFTTQTSNFPPHTLPMRNKNMTWMWIVNATLFVIAPSWGKTKTKTK